MANTQKELHRPFKPSSRSRGFTLVELTVVIIVLGILATIVTFTVVGVQARARDAKRSSSVASIVEKLESYYYTNSKYPSCPALTSFTSPVFKGLPQAALIAPSNKDLSQPSLKCQDVTTSTTDDIYGYMGDGTNTCQTGSFCSSWTLKYKEESTGKIISTTSRHKSTIPVPDAPDSIVMVASANGTTGAMGTSGVASCTVGSPQYSLGSRTNEEAWTAYTDWSPSRILTISSTNEGGRYSFRAQARCVHEDFISDAVASNEADYIRPIGAPAAPVLAKSPNVASGTVDTVAFSWSAVSCPVGTTVEYNRTWGRDDGTDYRPYITDTVLSIVVATNYQGFEYKAKAQARCVSPYISSSWSVDSNQPTYLRSIAAPGNATNFRAETSNGGATYLLTFDPPTCGLGLRLEGRSRYWAWDASGSGGGQPYVIKGAVTNDQFFARWKNASALSNSQLDLVPRAYVDPARGGDTTSYIGDYLYGPVKSASFGLPRTARVVVQYRCMNANTSTGRFSEGAVTDSGIRSF